MVLFVVATMMPAVGRGEPAKPRRGGAPSSDRGLVITSEPGATPLAQTTPAADFARQHYARRIALTIGVDAYSGRPWRRLSAAVADARHMAALFRAMGFDRVETLEDADREAILDTLERRLPLDVGPRDLVVVFFAGHGATAGGEGHIIPRDGDEDLERTGIPVRRLEESALRTRARHTLFLMDSCFSGIMLRRAELDRVNDLAYWRSAAQGRAVQILTAGRADELVQESGGWGRFTRAVHAGLAGDADHNRDGVVTTEELAVHTDRRVQRDSKGRQHPQWGTMEGTGTALLVDLRRLPVASQPPAPRPRAVIRDLEGPLARIHERMERRDWAQAEKLLRDLMVDRGDAELRLLLAEVYIEADAPGNASLIEAELRRLEVAELTPAEQRRMLDLRARLEKARRRAP